LAPWQRRYGRLAPGSDFRGIAFPPTQNPVSEAANIAVINGKAIISRGVSGQVALQSRHEVRPLPKRLDFGKPHHEINCSGSFSNVRLVKELHEFADQIRMATLKHRTSIPCQPIFKIIESRPNSVKKLFKQLLAIGLEEFIEIFFAKIFLIAVFLSSLSFTAVVNGGDRSVGDVVMFSSISGSVSTDADNF
jgi:hypothetical protein